MGAIRTDRDFVLQLILVGFEPHELKAFRATADLR
jgi:hypothetical protein